MKKILIAIFLVTILAGSTLSMAIPSAIKKINESSELIKNYSDIDESENITFFTTQGPKKISIMRMKINNGSLIGDRTQLKMSIAETIFFRLALMFKYPLVRPLFLFISPENKIDFTVEYKKDIVNGNESRNKYLTYITRMENGNITTNNTIDIYNKKHTVVVEGFCGLIIITKRSFRMPPSVIMFGPCDNATLVPTLL